MSNCILIIDIETTNFLNRGGKIVEVGIVELNLDTGDTKTLFDKVVYELGITKEIILNSWIIKNSSLELGDFVGAKLFSDELEEIQAIIDKYPLGCTAFNNVFDFDFMEDRGVVFHKKLPCPMRLLTPIMKLPKSLKAIKAGFGKGYKWPSVEEAYAYFFPDSDYKEAHRGGDDALHEAQIVFQMFKSGNFKIE